MHKWQREREYRLIKDLWRLMAIVLRCDLLANGVMILVSGIDPMAVRIASLMPKESCIISRPASMIWQSQNLIGSSSAREVMGGIIGLKAAVQIVIVN
jgi:hypothetical protein